MRNPGAQLLQLASGSKMTHPHPEEVSSQVRCLALLNSRGRCGLVVVVSAWPGGSRFRKPDLHLKIRR
ncbi:hypothetical protein AVEN_186052-1 [Araneus ventricosus]|uniref:Uncharacterized protein n=1 Tax=Araneus ventricosus TaxID=182803 RepID=A0A4Y2RXK8_ARAVE|nr:hypothetical protein AVEN_186052-1 [Araneus ventricosus]